MLKVVASFFNTLKRHRTKSHEDLIIFSTHCLCILLSKRIKRIKLRGLGFRGSSKKKFLGNPFLAPYLVLKEEFPTLLDHMRIMSLSEDNGGTVLQLQVEDLQLFQDSTRAQATGGD